MAALTSPFFEIGPKNLLRRSELEELAHAAGRAGKDFNVAVVLTVPAALVAPIADLHTGVHVFAQGMSVHPPGDSVGSVIAEALVDAGATGVMLNHDGNPLPDDELAMAINRARETGLQTIVCAGTEHTALRYAALAPTAILFEPPELIGTAHDTRRPWIRPSTSAIRQVCPNVFAMHAGGVASASIARAIMAAGADGTGSTSGVLTAADPLAAARSFIAAARAGWEEARTDTATQTDHQH